MKPSTNPSPPQARPPAYKTEPIAPAKARLSAPGQKIPATVFTSADILPNCETLSRVAALTTDSRLFHHIAVLSEAFAKSHTPNPTGSVVASEHHILPQMLDTAPNCGMRLILTDLNDSELEVNRIAHLFSVLKQAIPTRALIGEKIPFELLMDVVRYGSAPLLEQFSIRTKQEIERTLYRGTFFGANAPTRRDIRDSIPQAFLKMAQRRLGILGATQSHFVTLVRFHSLRQSELATKLGVRDGQYAFFMHTGSGILGQYAMRLYTPKKQSLLGRVITKAGEWSFDSQLIKYYGLIKRDLERARSATGEITGWSDDSFPASMYLMAHNAVANYGFANRTLLTHYLDQALEKEFKRPINLSLLSDAPHVYVARERHFDSNVWVYRNGATRATEGEPVMMAPLVSTDGYLGVGTGQNADTFFSANHEIGKIGGINLDAMGDKSATPPINSNLKVYTTKHKIAPLADSRFMHYADRIAAEMEQNDIMRLVAKFEPIATLTY